MKNEIKKYFKKYNHTFEFSEHVSMFQTSSSAIVSVTLKFLQDNLYIYMTINTMTLCRLNVRYKYVKFKQTNNIIENTTDITVKV